jgi:Ser/Thr protein kinase RdoA (MazF antagonist)
LRAGPDTDEIVGVIDFGDMVHAPLVQDLAVTLASFARHGEMSLDNAVAQVEAWNAVLPLTDDELEILHDLVLCGSRRRSRCTTFAFARSSSRPPGSRGAARHRARAVEIPRPRSA